MNAAYSIAISRAVHRKSEVGSQRTAVAVCRLSPRKLWQLRRGSPT